MTMDRPEICKGQTRKLKTGCGNLYITINVDEAGAPYETFIRVGKAGGCAASQTEALGRLITLLLRAKTPMDILIKQLRGISCHQPEGLGARRVLSCADALGKALQLYAKADAKLLTPPTGVAQAMAMAVGCIEDRLAGTTAGPVIDMVKVVPAQGACPECGGQVIFQEGCRKCLCGWTEC
jgi:ribonucleoside-diphosphate reductase alpha chain